MKSFHNAKDYHSEGYLLTVFYPSSNLFLSHIFLNLFSEYKIAENNRGAGTCGCERPKDAKAELGR
jgi:hypothetical protein